MGQKFDVLYGEMVEDPLDLGAEPTIKEGEDPDRIVAVLKSRAEGYFKQSGQFRDKGNNANAEAMMSVCRELAYLAKEIEAGHLGDLESKGE